MCSHAVSGAEVAAVPLISWCVMCHTYCGLATSVVSSGTSNAVREVYLVSVRKAVDKVQAS